MNRQEEGLRETVRRKQRFVALMAEEGWVQVEKSLKDKYARVFEDFLDGADPIVSRETLKAIKSVFEEIGSSFASAEYAKRDLEKLLKVKGYEKNG